MKRIIWKKNLLLIGLVVLLSALPLYLCRNGTFEGADDAATGAVQKVDPHYSAWAKPWLQPKSGEVETFLFAAQAAIGAGVVGFVLGRITKKDKTDDRNR